MNFSLRFFRLAFFFGVSVKLLSGLCRIFLPFDLPHRWRQIDTMGVAMRYYLRWTTEHDWIAPLLPAVLNSKDHYGITPMEFPIFNLLAAPMFLAGPLLGSVLAKALIFLIHILLTIWCSRLWKGTSLFTIRMEYLCLCFGLLSVSSTYVFKFMPDYASFLLVFIALSGAWNRQWRMLAFCLASIGLLMKPTSIIVFGFCLLHPEFKNFLRRNIVWIAASACVGLAYYTLGMNYIRAFQDGQDLFAVHLRSPWVSLLEVFSDPKGMFVLLANKLFFAPGLFLMLLAAPLMSREHRRFLAKLSAILLLQILAIFILDGSHSFVHDYYYIGCAPVLLAIVFTMVIGVAESEFKYRSICLGLFFVLALIKFFDQIQFETRTALPFNRARTLLASDCEVLKNRHPELPWSRGYVFRSSNQPYPELGVCFFEREGSETSEFGLFKKTETLPSNCRGFDEEGLAVLAKCHNSE